MRVFCAIFLLLSLTGCPSTMTHGDPVPVHDKLPVLEEPQRPKLEKFTPEELADYSKLPEPVRKKLESNNDSLEIYADKLRAAIREYNGFSKLTNQKNDVWVKGGLKDEPLPKDGK